MRIRSQAPPVMGAVWNSRFITGRYVRASCPAAWAVTPTTTHRLVKIPAHHADPVSDRQLNR